MRSRRASSDQGARKQPRAVTSAAVRWIEPPGSGAPGPEARIVRSAISCPSGVSVRVATTASIVRTSPVRPAASVQAMRSPSTGSEQASRQAALGTEYCRAASSCLRPSSDQAARAHPPSHKAWAPISTIRPASSRAVPSDGPAILSSSVSLARMPPASPGNATAAWCTVPPARQAM